MQKQLLLAAAVLATLLVSSSGFTFYKLSLQWPTSTCNRPSARCRTPVPSTFTIHGLWPQFADDTPVPPYSKNQSCTKLTPVPGAQLMTHLQPLEAQLNVRWPSVLLAKTNADFWRHEWEKHGMCSDYADNPAGYFNATLILANNPNYDPLQVMGIQPGTQTTTNTVMQNIYNKFRAYPELSCNMNGQVRQLSEVRFCFDRTIPPFRIRGCPTRFSNACSTFNDTILLPSVLK